MKKNKSTFTINFITYSLMLSLAGVPVYAVDFNTDVLDAADRQNIDFSRFSRAGYIMPGQYQMEIRVNGQDISPSAFQIAFLEPPFSDSDNEKPLPEPCLTPEIVSRMGLTEASQEKVTYWNNGQCADFRQLSGVEIRCVFRSIRSRIGIEVRSAIRIHSINRELNFFYRFLTRFFAAFHYRGIFPQ